MPRNGAGVYAAPTGTLATTLTPIPSAAYNAFVNDLVADANFARPIAAGGTGATTAAQARTNLGLGAVATLNTIPIANGGTGATTAAAARTALGLAAVATTGAYSDLSGIPAPIPALTQAQVENAASTVFGTASGQRLAQAIQARVGWVNVASVATTSGTAFNIGSIPNGISELEIYLDGVSLNGAENLLLQIGTGASPQTTGYVGSSAVAGSTVGAGRTDGWPIWLNVASRALVGRMHLVREPGTNKWFQNHLMHLQDGFASTGAGVVSLGGNLNNLRLTRTGSDTFDAGAFWARYR